jgi:hypothetical protein
MSYKYLGPSDNFVMEDKPGAKVYHRGDTVPLNKEQMESLVRNGHYFEGVTVAPTTNLAEAVVIPDEGASSGIMGGEVPEVVPTKKDK